MAKKGNSKTETDNNMPNPTNDVGGQEAPKGGKKPKKTYN